MSEESAPRGAQLSSSSTSNREGKVVQGLCGWSCSSLVKCRRFFPPRTAASSSTDKLSFLSRGGGHGCVEVNSTTYAIPSPDTVASWVRATSQHFIFHFKAFGILCGSTVVGRSLPHSLRVRHGLQADSNYSLDTIPEEARKDLWRQFNESLGPAVSAGKAGAVLFQFHLSFVPSDANRSFIERCANDLRNDVNMVVEFRNRSWLFADAGDGPQGTVGGDADFVISLKSFNSIGRHLSGQRLQDTCLWLRSLQDCRPGGVALAASEDLFHEVYAASPPPFSIATSSTSRHCSLPTVLTAFPTPALAYIRVHRREGTNRLLTDDEINRWADAVTDLLEEKDPKLDVAALRGPCFILWGTDHEDQPIKNMKRLQTALPATCLVGNQATSVPAVGIAALFAAKSIKKQGVSQSSVHTTDTQQSSEQRKRQMEEQPTVDQQYKRKLRESEDSCGEIVSESGNHDTPKKKKATIDMFFKKTPT